MEVHIKRGFILLALVASTFSCSLFDAGTEWQDGPYALLWIDLPENVQLAYHQGKGGWAPLVEYRVFAVGSNSRYIVAKQHPNGDKSITNFYLIDRSKDEFHCVQGPMNELNFSKASKDLGLPTFTKTLHSLE